MCLTRDDSIFSYGYLQTTSIHQASSKKFRPSQPLAAILAPATDLKKKRNPWLDSQRWVSSTKKGEQLEEVQVSSSLLIGPKN